jgi:hypothetical protein
VAQRQLIDCVGCPLQDSSRNAFSAPITVASNNTFTPPQINYPFSAKSSHHIGFIVSIAKGKVGRFQVRRSLKWNAEWKSLWLPPQSAGLPAVNAVDECGRGIARSDHCKVDDWVGCRHPQPQMSSTVHYDTLWIPDVDLGRPSG